MDENSPIYADETETVVFRVKDYRQVIEAHYQLPVKELVFEGESPYPEWASDQPEHFQKPLKWFFRDFERVGLLLPDGNTPLTAPKHEEG